VSYTPAPVVTSILLANTNPTAANTAVGWSVVLNTPVTGVDSADFLLVSTGAVSGASLTAVTGSGTSYTVTANTGTGTTGTLALRLVDDDTIVNATSMPLGGSGADNGTFTGQAYTLVPPAPTLSKTVSSSAGVIGDVVTFSVTAANTFASPLSDVVITDTLPAGLTYAASAPTLGTVAVAGQVITWTIPSIPAGGNAQLILAINLLQQGAWTNTVSAPGATSATASILVLPAATTHFKMDEPAGSWTGAVGEVLDSGGTGLQGRRVTTAAPTTTNTVSPTPTIASQNGSVVGGFCNAGYFDGKAVVTVSSNPLLQYTNKLSASAWIYYSANPGELFSILSNDVNYEFHINSSGKLFWWWGGPTLTSSATIPKNTWTHVAITFDSSAAVRRQRIYINGVLDSNTNNWTGTLQKNNCDFYIGGDINTGAACALNAGRNFRGSIDEVKLYNYELSASEVQADMNLGRSCSGVFDHIQIEHDASASVCTPETVVIKACLDAACSSLYTGNVTVNLTTPSGASWVNGATFTFNNGITTRQLSKGTAGNVTLATTSISPLATNPTTCEVNGVNSCNLNFALASCAFDAVEVGANPQTRIFTKLSGTSFNLNLLAMGSGTTINTTYTGTVAVDLVDTSVAACPTSTGLTTAANITFASGDSGRKVVTFNYPNAARNVRVRARVGTTTPACSTDNFAIRPTTYSSVYSSDANADSGGASATATPAVKAGTAFQVVADTNVVGYDGTPKANVTQIEWIGAPAGGRPAPGVGSLSGGPAFSTAASATTGNGASGSFTYDEVGYFRFKVNGVYDDTFTATSGDPAGADCVVGSFSNTLSSGKYGCNFGNMAVSSHVGRFAPDHFAVVSPTFTPGCGTFTYMGQPFTLSATLQAQNQAKGKTSNFSGAFGTATVEPELENANDGVSLSLARLTGLGTPSWATGEYPFVATGLSRLNAPDGAYDNLDIGLKVLPTNVSDTARLTNRDMAAINTSCTADPTDTSGGTCTAVRVATAAKFRFGRLRLQNAYGSERLPLSVPIQAQYWSGSSFVKNADDGCTPLAVPPPQTMATPNGTAGRFYSTDSKNQLVSPNPVPVFYTAAAPPITTTQLAGGQANLTFAAPQLRGWLDIILQVPDYLTGNWGNCSGQTGTAGLHDDLPCARATFGIYGSKSPIIYRRENY